MAKFLKKTLPIILTILLFVFSVTISQKPVSAKDDEVKLRVFIHYPKEPGKPEAVNTCSPTTNDQVTDYGLTGWHMLTSGMTYKINYATKPRNFTDTQVYNAISSAFNTWRAADLNQIFTYGGTTSARTAKYDGQNAILWQKTRPDALAITYSWYWTSTGELSESDTVFNSKYKWTQTTYNGANDCGGVQGTYDLQNIATHEFGHWIGLDDLYSPVDEDLTMYGYGDTAELKKDTLGAGDILGVNYIIP